MWGTRPVSGAPYLVDRFIPTHVGNARSGSTNRSARTVHPHACGERITAGCSRLMPYGSSPRMWGTLPCRRHREEVHRFIPTHVGNANSPQARCSTCPVHPHACGERAIVAALMAGGTGSSPRMWGTPPEGHVVGDAHRFIPTHVGNASPPAASASWSPVHPHACGERAHHDDLPHVGIGSSPRMWGTHLGTVALTVKARFIPTHVGNAPNERFIPTHVGNASFHRSTCARGAVHPHACGERRVDQPISVRVFGSSPRMWGTLVQGAAMIPARRFIPTHVGNAMNVFSGESHFTVHPHACGERRA